jgi:hypothetical protein
MILEVPKKIEKTVSKFLPARTTLKNSQAFKTNDVTEPPKKKLTRAALQQGKHHDDPCETTETAFVNIPLLNAARALRCFVLLGLPCMRGVWESGAMRAISGGSGGGAGEALVSH